MTMTPTRPFAQFVFVAGLLAAGPALAQNVILDCAGSGDDCTQRIPDGAGTDVTATILVPASADCGEFDARSIKVGVKALHANVGDLRFVLETPLGDDFTLLTRAREFAGAPVGSCAGDDVDIKFVDGAPSTPTCAELAPALTLRRAPETGMASLAGPIQSGTWRLHAADLSAGGDGVLTNWSLNFTCDNPETDVFADSLES